MTRRIPWFIVLASALAAGPAARPAAAPAQTPAGGQTTPAQQPTFRARIDSVVVDVSVTDKQGRPVTDLAQSDFEIRENNKPQTVETFKLIQIDDTADTGANGSHAIRSESDEARELARDDTRLIVIFLDDYHVRLINSMRVRDQLAAFVNQLSPRDLVAVMYPLTPPDALAFSYDDAGVADAVSKFVGRKYDYTPRNPIEEQYQQMPPEVQEQMRNQVVISALQSLCTYLGTVRDGRKTVLYVSEGMTGTLPPGATTTGTLGGSTGIPASQTVFDSMRLMEDFKYVFAAAGRSNTSIYTLDPRGLAGSEFGVNDNVTAGTDQQALSESTDLLRTIANQTDGRAIVNRNNPLPELRQMLRDTSAYYLLGYTSTVAARDGKFHEIDVRVKRKDVDVHARKGYWAYTAEEAEKALAPPKAGPPAEVGDALETLAAASRPAGDHPVRVWLGAAPGTGPTPLVTLAWDASAAVAPRDAADAVDHVEVVATADDGSSVFRGDVPQSAGAAGRVAGQTTFAARPGTVAVHVVAVNASGQRLDTDDTTIEVPDFTAVGPAITEPVVFRAQTAHELQQIRAAAAPVPAVGREFSRTEQLLLRFHVLGPAGTSPAVTMRLLNQQGDQMATLPPPTGAGAGAYEAQLGLAALAPADYLIEIAADVGGQKVRRLLAIRITN
jgi:VWFA-related protein